MVYQVKTVNGQKTKIPLSDPAPTGNPIGTIISTYKKIQPKNYLYCDGSFFDETLYPALYLYLGSNQLPDYRECVMVGAEENTTDQIATHDVYAQGEFKDDQNKSHHHTVYGRTAGGTSSISNTYPISTHGIIGHASSNLEYAETTSAGGSTNNIIGDEGGNVARGKRKAVYVYIKAVDGVDISDENTFLNTVKDYVANMMNNWVDVSSDFSVVDSISWADTPISSLKVLYNAYQKKLKVWSWYNSSKSASSTHAFTLQYDGNNTDIVFDPTTTTAMQTLNKSYLGYDTTTNPDSSTNSNGFEGSYNIRTSNQVRLGGFCRNSGTGWGASICIVAEISL